MKYNINMKKNILSIIVFVFFITLLTTSVFAQDPGSTTGLGGQPIGGGNATNPSNPQATGFNLDFTVPNPIQANNFDEFMAKLLEIVFLIAIPVITFFIIYSGFLFVTAQGNAEKIETAKKNFMWVLIGSAILLASWLLANAIGETVKQTFAP